MARAIGRLPRLQNWVGGKQSIIDSAEHNLLTFYHEAPAAFWASLSLNLLWARAGNLGGLSHPVFMGARIPVVGAFVFEGLTKVINLVGALNPGNLGTYEGGNMRKDVRCGGHCWINARIVPMRAHRFLGRSWGHVHACDEEGRVGKAKIEVKAHEKDLFLHRASSCIAAIGCCDQGSHSRRAV
jgi:hypothetical protein